jgi:hypothetical protein
MKTREGGDETDGARRGSTVLSAGTAPSGVGMSSELRESTDLLSAKKEAEA